MVVVAPNGKLCDFHNKNAYSSLKFLKIQNLIRQIYLQDLYLQIHATNFFYSPDGQLQSLSTIFCSSHVIDLSMNATYLHGRWHCVYTSSKYIHNPFAMLSFWDESEMRKNLIVNSKCSNTIVRHPNLKTKLKI